jgi:hypothetical protein
MAAAILVPVAIIAALGLNMLLQWERASRIRSVEETGRATALTIDREIAVAEASLRGIVNSEALRADDLARLHREAGAMDRATPWTWTFLSNVDGRPLFNTRVPFGTPLPYVAKPWVKGLFESQKTRISGVYIGNLTHKPTVSIDVPVPRAAGRPYVVSQAFDASYFARVFTNGNIDPAWLVTIFDANGISLARSRNADQLVGKPVRPELYQASRRTPNGLLRHRTHEGVDVYSIYTRAPLSGWTVAIGVPAAEIEAAARTATAAAALSLLALLGLAIAIALFLGRRLSDSLDQARGVAQALAGSAPDQPGACERTRGTPAIAGRA